MLWLPRRRGEPIGRLRAHTRPVSAVTFARDGSLLATGDEDGNIFLWDPVRVGNRELPNTYRGLLEAHADPVLALAFSADGSFLISAGGAPGKPGEIQMWRARK